MTVLLLIEYIGRNNGLFSPVLCPVRAALHSIIADLHRIKLSPMPGPQKKECHFRNTLFDIWNDLARS